MTLDLVGRAEELSRRAHAGQVDKSGAPYVEHPGRVAALVEQRADTANRETAVAAAWLHDVAEDTEVTVSDLRLEFGDEVANIVDALSKRSSEDRAAYYERVRATGPLAVLVKLADLDDNTDPERVAKLDADTRERLTAKYANARAVLAGHPQ